MFFDFYYQIRSRKVAEIRVCFRYPFMQLELNEIDKDDKDLKMKMMVKILNAKSTNLRQQQLKINNIGYFHQINKILNITR